MNNYSEEIFFDSLDYNLSYDFYENNKMYDEQFNQPSKNKSCLRWNSQEQNLYKQFIMKYFNSLSRQQLDLYKTKQNRFFYEQMASFLGNTKTILQCKSHHQKFRNRMIELYKLEQKMIFSIETQPDIQNENKLIQDQPLQVLHKKFLKHTYDESYSYNIDPRLQSIHAKLKMINEILLNQ